MGDCVQAKTAGQGAVQVCNCIQHWKVEAESPCLVYLIPRRMTDWVARDGRRTVELADSSAGLGSTLEKLGLFPYPTLSGKRRLSFNWAGRQSGRRKLGRRETDGIRKPKSHCTREKENADPMTNLKTQASIMHTWRAGQVNEAHQLAGAICRGRHKI